MDKVENLRPRISTYRTSDIRNVLFGAVIGIMLLLAFVIMLFLFNLTFGQMILSVLSILVLYIILLTLLIRSTTVKVINRTQIRTKQPEVREVIVERPVVKEVYVETPKAPLNIPRYEYVGSTQTRTYHTRNCRLGKLIKAKYKLSDNSPAFFKKRKFKGCKVCIQKKKRV